MHHPFPAALSRLGPGALLQGTLAAEDGSRAPAAARLVRVHSLGNLQGQLSITKMRHPRKPALPRRLEILAPPLRSRGNLPLLQLWQSGLSSELQGVIHFEDCTVLSYRPAAWRVPVGGRKAGDSAGQRRAARPPRRPARTRRSGGWQEGRRGLARPGDWLQSQSGGRSQEQRRLRRTPGAGSSTNAELPSTWTRTSRMRVHVNTHTCTPTHTSICLLSAQKA